MSGRVYPHGHVYQVGHQWYYEAQVGGVTYLRDDVSSWRKCVDLCLRDVMVLSRIYNAGHRLTRSYAEIVERAVSLDLDAIRTQLEAHAPLCVSTSPEQIRAAFLAARP